MRPDQNGEAAQPGLPFGEALAALKCGRRVAREGWNGKGLWLYYVPAATYNAMTDAAREHIGDVVPYNAYLALVSGGKVSTWAPSTNDALAEDWFVLPEAISDGFAKTATEHAREKGNRFWVNNAGVPLVRALERLKRARADLADAEAEVLKLV